MDTLFFLDIVPFLVQVMGSTAVGDLIEAVSGVHFSGFRLGETGQTASEAEQHIAASKNGKQPFVIGTRNVFISTYDRQIVVTCRYF